MQIKRTVRSSPDADGLVKEVAADLTIEHMNIRGGMLRSKLVGDAFAAPREDAIDQTIAVITYPKLMACLSAGTITRKVFKGDELVEGTVQDARTLTLDEFIALPDEIGVLWSAAVIQENPTLDSVAFDANQQPIVTEDAAKKS